MKITTMFSHPLSQLSLDETNLARDVIVACHPDAVLDFRMIFLLEPPKAEVVEYLNLEHTQKLTHDTRRPQRLAQARYDVIGENKLKAPEYHESVIDLISGRRVAHEVVGSEHHASLTLPNSSEFETLVNVCKKSDWFQEKLAQFKLPEGFEVVIEPWPYGGGEAQDKQTRFFQGLIFARDTRSGNPDTNFYAFPLPLIPIMDAHKREVVRIEELATGGKGEQLTGKTHAANAVDHCRASEYVPELLPNGVRKGLKPLTVLQPEGPSFTVTDGNLVQWQKWSMRVTFNPREGAVIHDVRFDDRSILYRLSMSDMTVPYADPRPPFHRKQAFDFGDGALGDTMNNLTLGCDCLGLIKYFDGVLIDSSGTATPTKNVICLHEQDSGINWKHTNWRTGRAVLSRRRELVIQFIITLANYEYIFAFRFDQSAAITLESRATGIVSVVNIDPDKTSPYGTVVSPGVLAQNHQHIFCARIDPAIDGHSNTLIQEDTLPLPIDARKNPHGNAYEIRKTPIPTSTPLDACPSTNRVFKIINPHKTNPISRNPVAYKFAPLPTQLLLAHPNSIQAHRAAFAQRHLWLTKFKDDELYAAGRYTLQSRREIGGVSDAAARNDDVLDADLVLWCVFGLTHNPRVEDWPVMPVEVMQLKLVPADFFVANPAIDVPVVRDVHSVTMEGCCAGVEMMKNGD
ncbi:copper amine oxidase [Pseudovirgaria hyperparasitica]|uniref:Amine oxidase n=1 Tax=Pseudovirgaria hyperparasitica TaxID=470096 RepID=A0A6A6WI18_9PEZI|nr:copper amine oxidase [Pseudovirgaria hyperparasitica]KAF2762453.1 copper amine oxidase [Pseudovirgaria hyperparasitica]